MLKAILLFAAGLLFLIKGGDWFVDGSVSIARKYKIPEILIGATVVSIGTTIPEVLVSSIAAIQSQSQTAYGNAIGSVICNTALIAAITCAVRPTAKTDTSSLKMPFVFFLIAAVFYSFTAYFFKSFSRISGLILLALFLIYMIISVKDAVALSRLNKNDTDNQGKNESLSKAVFLIVAGAAVIAVGARLLVNNGLLIAGYIGVPESVIALTFVALGTSLPELVTAITSLVKGHSSLSLGNIIGANLFNLVLVSGLAITIRPFDVPAEKLIGALNASFVVDIPLMFTVMLILVVPALIKKRIRRWQGIVLLSLYALYITFQFVN